MSEDIVTFHFRKKKKKDNYFLNLRTSDHNINDKFAISFDTIRAFRIHP